MKRTLIFAALALLAAGCSQKPDWTEKELDIINGQGPVMRVLTIAVPEDSLVLRTPSTGFSIENLQTEDYSALAAKMVETVTSPEQDGVGIAGPQVGILRRIVAVQRFDKEGEPFEVYPNIRITAFRAETEPGPEGCLSVPDMRGYVMRYRDIDIAYTSPATLQDTTETVQGYSAVIFQHECDHLDGILYTDKLCDISE
ncbi:MAG: peptide deformylase [Bacteroidales bacterium]|nr:peptide deformylase [Bacteroidales bacterium]